MINEYSTLNNVESGRYLPKISIWQVNFVLLQDISYPVTYTIQLVCATWIWKQMELGIGWDGTNKLTAGNGNGRHIS